MFNDIGWLDWWVVYNILMLCTAILHPVKNVRLLSSAYLIIGFCYPLLRDGFHLDYYITGVLLEGILGMLCYKLLDNKTIAISLVAGSALLITVFIHQWTILHFFVNIDFFRNLYLSPDIIEFLNKMSMEFYLALVWLNYPLKLAADKRLSLDSFNFILCTAGGLILMNYLFSI